MDMTPTRWTATAAYLDAVFGEQDDHLATLMTRAIEAGLPDIAVSASVGRFLHLLAKLANARTIVEVGTLAGYSGIWLARALPEGGRLITIEPVEKHAAFAERAFADAGVGGRVTVRRGTGLEILPKLVDELGPGSVDLVFLDAVKQEYPEYWPHAKTLVRHGGLVVADNALGSGDWWIGEPAGNQAAHDGADALNRLAAADPAFDASCLPIREGMMVARKRELTQ
ncbi:MAG: O-methyltransferase [Planctomycetota bacterium]|nr:MAG: O-methyltransferase [Planctomycetota bacterium]